MNGQDWQEIKMSETMMEALEALYIELPAGQITAFDALMGMQSDLQELQDWLDSSLELEGKSQDQLEQCHATIKAMRSEMAKLARKLANAGEDDHRRKNEVILWVIARLLYIGETPKTDNPMDDIPF